MTGCDASGQFVRRDRGEDVRQGRTLLGGHTPSEMRSLFVRIYRSAGKPVAEIAGALGVSEPTVRRWARVPVPALPEVPASRD